MSDRAEVARRLGFTRALTNLLDLTLLATDLLERVLGLKSIDEVEPSATR